RLVGGQSAAATADAAPVLRVDIAPEDAVRWALHYPGTVAVDASAHGAPLADARRRLAVGRFAAAQRAIDAALAASPGDADALALGATIALAQNRRADARQLAQSAVDSAETANALLALSYVQQADFDLRAARQTLQRAVDRYPQQALLWSRLAELQAALGDSGAALQSAQRAVAIEPGLSRTQTVLGFARLRGTDPGAAAATFDDAIALDPADPLPRLGRGLAQIRAGDLPGGRRDIEIAASLDPGNSLIRSYLGKAYAAEGRIEPAATELQLAKDLDPRDPTPWLYDALIQRDDYREIAAIRSFEQSAARNDQRAVFRSRLLLDDDLASRNALIGNTYAAVGLRQLGLRHAHAALAANPGNASAHGLLADLHRNQPRLGMARLSEALQARMLQPLSARPRRASEQIRELDTGAGAAVFGIGGNDFSTLFAERDARFAVSTYLGTHDTFGIELTHSQLFDNFSYSVGYFDYTTDGFRTDADVDQDSHFVSGQWRVADNISLLFELRNQSREQGDLRLGIDPRVSPDSERRELEHDVVQVGVRAALDARTQLLASLALSDRDERRISEELLGTRTVDDDLDGRQVELQLQHRRDGVHAIVGVARRDVDRDFRSVLEFPPILIPPFPPIVFPPAIFEDDDFVRSTSAYLYTSWNPTDAFTATIGASHDSHDDPNGPNAGDRVDYSRTNPKAGIQWQVLPGATARAVYAETTKHQLVAETTLEPTTVAGFTQFYDDPDRSFARLHGVGLDLRVNESLSAVFEATNREVDTVNSDNEIIEKRVRVELAAILGDRVTATVGYERRNDEIAGFLPFDLRTDLVPLTVSYRDPRGYFADARWTVFDQDWKPAGEATIASSFHAVDIAGGVRWGRNRYQIAFGVSDLLDDVDEYRDDRRLINDQLAVIRPFVPGRTFWGSIQLAWD
nr:TonB-dependent receptor [Gammaproteobacteria bacterium]